MQSIIDYTFSLARLEEVSNYQFRRKTKKMKYCLSILFCKSVCEGRCAQTKSQEESTLANTARVRLYIAYQECPCHELISVCHVYSQTAGC
jgi:hypothetical protein